ncbi:MAG: hypothetical protein LUG55_00985 [Clostridiales bacterium]|nr:hypothetical protein [Clostridiales bacterium]
MSEVSTNISFDVDLKKASQELFADLDLDLTAATLNEYYEMKAHPEKYPRHSSFKAAMDEVLADT